MKTIIYFLVFYISFTGFSQKLNQEEIIYLDFFNHKTTKKDAVYFVLKKPYKNQTSVYLKYIRSKLDSVVLVEKYFYNKKEEKQGKYTTFFPSGQIKSVGFYKDNFKTGQWKFYSKKNIVIDNTIKSSSYYHKLYTYKDGKTEGKFNEFYSNNQLRGEGNYKNNHFIGQCKWYFKNGQTSSDEFYNGKGKLKKIKQWYEDGTLYKGKLKPLKGPAQKKYFSKKISKYIFANFNQNLFKKYSNKKGRLYANFKVNKEGKIVNIKVKTHLPTEFRKEVKRLLLNYKLQSPPYYHNQLISIKYTLPISFVQKAKSIKKYTVKKRL